MIVIAHVMSPRIFSNAIETSKQQVSRCVRRFWRNVAFLLYLAPLFCVSSLAKSEPKSEAPIASAFAATIQKIPYSANTLVYTTQWTITNHWSFPLQVERFETSCGCLVGKIEDAPIAPGASGVLFTTMTPGNHRGLLRKSIHVRFVGHAQAVELVVEALIPNGVEVSERELHWREGEKKTQSIDITSGTGAPFSITGLLGVPETLFTIKQETVIPQKHYRISITPLEFRNGHVQCLQIRTDSADPRDQVVPVFFSTVQAATP